MGEAYFMICLKVKQILKLEKMEIVYSKCYREGCGH